ncbi:hypothetical protein RHMOL_Rhmol05G0265800 [Rhododendron molle]|uniref:Uncharacterized protein n=1 Tax=Rhododendron molle TaxID=49168 RepID=A0ACC0NVM8_RHOML|nr:hypothetical protein RHMOL_Rhmol05G0265800 [Rhododendron molle]
MAAEEDRARAVWRTRLGSAFRTALACAMVGCATLYGPEPLRTLLPFPAFAYVTAILIVSDATLGDSVKGCWHALLATAQVLPASVLSLWVIGPERFSAGVAAATVAAGAFMVAVPEWSHLMTKRIAFGQIVIVYVGAVVYGKEAGVVMHPIHVAASTALGALASVLAMLLPYPRLAHAESSIKTKSLYKRYSDLMEGVQWERPQIRPKPYLGKPELDRLEDIEIQIRRMETALTCCSFVRVSFIDQELREILLAMEVQICLKLEQAKFFPPVIDASTPQEPKGRELFNKLLDSIKTINPNSENRTSFFFLSCIKLLLDDLTTAQQNRMRSVEKSNNEGSRNSVVQEEVTALFKRIVPRNETLLFAFKCSISLGLAVFFGLVFDKENGYWSGLAIAISFVAQRQATFRDANARAQGTALGSVYGVLGCFFFSKYPALTILALLPWIIFSSFLRHSQMYGHAGGVSAVIGALLILGRTDYGLPDDFAITRITETFIGLFCFVTVELLLQPTRAATLAKKQLSQSLGALRECINQVGISADKKDMDLVFLTLRKKQEKLKLHLNQLEKFAGESELEPNFWFLPFQIGCYNKMLMSLSKMVDLLLFMAVQMESLVEESQRCGVAWSELQELINSDLDLFKKDSSSSLRFLEKVTLIKSFSVFEREEKEIEDGPELRKSSDADVCIVEAEKIVGSLLQHSKEVTQRSFESLPWDQEGEHRSKIQMALCLSAVRFCICCLMRQAQELEKRIKELVQWENPSNRKNFYEIAGKINALFPE